MNVDILYVGTDRLRVTLPSGRAVTFSLEEPQQTVPADCAQDLLSPLVGGGRFVRVAGGVE